MASAKTAKQSEQPEKNQIVLQSGLSIEDLSREMAPFMESVNQQLESDDPAMQETAAIFAREFVGAKMTISGHPTDALVVRDRIAELYFAYLDLAKRIRGAVQQAEAMARRQERFAEIIRSNIEAWMLTSWDAKKITGTYREFRITKNPDKVMVLDESKIPAEFFDEVPATRVLNKTRLAETLKANEEIRESARKLAADLPVGKLEQIIAETTVPGAIIEMNRTRLDIK